MMELRTVLRRDTEIKERNQGMLSIGVNGGVYSGLIIIGINGKEQSGLINIGINGGEHSWQIPLSPPPAKLVTSEDKRLKEFSFSQK